MGPTAERYLPQDKIFTADKKQYAKLVVEKPFSVWLVFLINHYLTP